MAAKGDKVKSLMGPGGLRCGCCGANAGRRRKAHKRMVRKTVRAARKAQKRRAIREGRNAID